MEADQDRKRGLRLPKHKVVLEEYLSYRELARYSEGLERYLNLFGREKVLVIIYDDFKEDPARVYRETLRFLGVEESFQPSFQPINAYRLVRNRKVMHVITHPPQVLSRFARMLLPARLRKRWTQSLIRLNTENRPRPPMNADLRRRLQAEFAGEVEQLSALLGRDLSSWTRDTRRGVQGVRS